jgi:hypothetical protein
MPYRHRQPGYVILAVCLAIGALGAAIIGRTGQMPMIAMLIILLAVAVVFHSLTVEVDDNELRWLFGPGFWTYRLARDDIRAVAVVRNHWWNGFGIRTTPGFRLYSVSGLASANIRRYPPHRHRRSRGSCGCAPVAAARRLEHDPEKWAPVFPRDKRGAFARRSCLIQNMRLDRDPIQSNRITI